MEYRAAGEFRHFLFVVVELHVLIRQLIINNNNYDDDDGDDNANDDNDNDDDYICNIRNSMTQQFIDKIQLKGVYCLFSD